MITLEINASAFNVLSDLLGTANRTVLLYAITLFYCYLMTVHVKSGRVIPADCLGKIPENFFDAYYIARQGGGLSRGLLLLMLLIFVAEFAHTISDINLRFETVILPSSQDSVLDTSKKNEDYLYHVVGEPYNARTQILFEAEADGTKSDHLLSNAFIAAADSIARGTSPLLMSEENGYNTPGFVSVHGVDMFLYERKDKTSLSTLPTKIPLNCDSLEKMKRITQSVSIDTSAGGGYDDAIDIIASIPNCDFSQKRESGIYQDKNQVDESVNITVTDFVRYIPSSLAGTDLNAPIKLRFRDGSESDTFNVPRAARGLARDRELGWKSGRTISGITDIIHNNNHAVKLGKMVFANAGNFLGLGIDHTSFDSTNEYIIVAEVDGNCPQGVVDPFYYDQRHCLAFIKTFCETFPEDRLGIRVDLVIAGGVEIPETSRCNLMFLEYVWGSNFGDIDYSFLAAVAGVFGRNRSSMKSPYDHILSINAILAAKFALSSVSEDFSTKEEVRPMIGFLWVFSMLLPVSCACVIAILSYIFASRTLPVPKDPWEVLIVSKEDNSSLIRARKKATDSFHNPKQAVKYGIVKEDPVTTLGFLKSRSIFEQDHSLQLNASEQGTGTQTIQPPAVVHGKMDVSEGEHDIRPTFPVGFDAREQNEA